MSHSFARMVTFTAGPAVIAFLIAGCGIDISVSSDDDVDDGPTVTESFDIEEFDRLSVGNAWTVVLTIGPEPSLEVEVAEDLLDDVEVEQDGDRLTLSMDGSRLFSSHRGTREARITTPSLTDLDVDGAATVEVSGLSGDQLDVDLAGAASVDLGEVELERLNIEVEGASSLDAVGSAEVVIVEAEGASSVDFASMTIDEADIDVSGASTVDVEGAAVVSGRVTGASSVDVADDASVSVRTEGASSID